MSSLVDLDTVPHLLPSPSVSEEPFPPSQVVKGFTDELPQSLSPFVLSENLRHGLKLPPE